MTNTDTVRRRTNDSNEQRPQEETTTVYSKYASNDESLNAESHSTVRNGLGLTLKGRLALFILFPILMGCVGLLMAYARSEVKDEEGNVKKINFDRDFIFPFLLALALVIVVGFQTSGFSQKEIKPLVHWPKVKRKRKIVYKQVIIDDEGNEIDESQITMSSEEKRRARKED
mmetsp:Transcript_5859/g.7394  ORF Transcript_5859/g.7394 Transcript_5859/m.7394 type:complete len:172 (+) Transcript_5859:39-554(+)|eukprot:CAMPEP_0172497194 /NCGR_PEP_ID=MMETSP1066-20121228/96458_1 /TAXON_ID=671091 /ORGANISM="Coscinodiscus wailesii, Strain CCMP2513" /LENGTH=171 /DNA_ID=CAMNT_0013269825 /DNA_START=17 /DNA_END=532 /DNA_ORIENTATION=-